ncbi:MAG: hypothetical protein CAPSK01_000513 [Candidatus Accumulibacter vicinus]|uniref:Uncharacterized protein n=1 Tax=Candidatus Accumulibacter vicinus TaxID=2954382 RepID=A0A084Y506_9PROT|nr:MAG: hypothetical protein CAPSK01_000513 [Candidatus Accumulibacter vicinus]
MDRPDGILAQATRIIGGMTIMDEFPGLAVEPVQSAFCAYPEHAVLVDEQGASLVGADTAGIIRVVLEASEFPGFSVETVQATAGRYHPQGSVLRVFESSPDFVVAQAAWVFGIVLVTGEALGFAVEPVQAIVGADPKRPLGIFVNGMNQISAQAVGILRIRFEHLERISIVAVEAIPGADPQKALTVLKKRFHRALRQPVIRGQVFEPDPGASVCADRVVDRLPSKDRGQHQ